MNSLWICDGDPIEHWIEWHQGSKSHRANHYPDQYKTNDGRDAKPGKSGDHYSRCTQNDEKIANAFGL